MKKYEIMYIMNVFLNDAARTKLMNSFHKIITDHEGTIGKVDEWGVKELMYEINHVEKGCYVVVGAAASNGEIHGFEHLARINHNTVRCMIIRTQDKE